MGKIIEFILRESMLPCWYRDFWVLTICGGVLLGVGPASATIMSLYAENGMTYKALSLVTRLGTLQRKSTPSQSSLLHLLCH